MLSRFETCKEFDTFRIHLAEFRKKKAKLDLEADLAQNAVNTSREVIEYAICTKKKLMAFTNLLGQIDASIASFNMHLPQHIDKTDEFHLGLELASHTMRCMIANMRDLIQYRDPVKPATMTVIAPLVIAGTAFSFFTAPAVAPSVAVATFFASSKLLASVGMSRSANYVGFAKSFSLIAMASDSLVNTLAELRTQASLSPDVDLKACYRALDIEGPALLSQIERRTEELMDGVRTKLACHIKANNYMSEAWQDENNKLADRMVELMRSCNLAIVDALHYNVKRDCRAENYNPITFNH